MKARMAAWDIRQGHVIDLLRAMPAESVHCAVTSPPYWSLRDYGVEPQVWGGDPEHEHSWQESWSAEGYTGRLRWQHSSNGRGLVSEQTRPEAWGQIGTGAYCACGAWRGSLGLEPMVEMYVEHLVVILREIRRVLRRDGTLWLNIGDCYASSPPGNTKTGVEKWATSGLHGGVSESYARTLDASVGMKRSSLAPGLKPKDLVGIPWRVALALQADGWWLRSDIIWSKPNPMPESIQDRATRSHEYLFLLAKSEHYYYDAVAIQEESVSDHPSGNGYKRAARLSYGGRGDDEQWQPTPRRNRRSVWTIPTQPFPEAHFATFPEALVEPCILAGTSEHGVCPECGAPWARVVEKATRFAGGSGKAGRTAQTVNRTGKWAGQQHGENIKLGPVVDVTTTGWRSTCPHPDMPVVPAIVLDPFAGAGTVGIVALRYGRAFLGLELNPEYVAMARRRIASALDLYARGLEPAPEVGPDYGPLFARVTP